MTFLFRLFSAAALAIPMLAHASIISLSDTFTATGLSGPVDTVTGSFTVTFDNATPVLEDTAGVSQFNANIVTGTVGFDYYNNMQDTLVIGGTISSVAGITRDTNDFILQIYNVSTPSTAYAYFDYSQAGFDNIAEAQSVTLAAQSGMVPEPATGTLMLAASVGMALVARRRRRQ